MKPDPEDQTPTNIVGWLFALFAIATIGVITMMLVRSLDRM